MRLLLDTQVLLWVLSEPNQISQYTQKILSAPESEVFTSPASLWEIVIKTAIGKLEANFTKITDQLAPKSKIKLLPIQIDHLRQLARLPQHPKHRDPFDRMLIAQAIADDMIFVSTDENAPLYKVKLLDPKKGENDAE